jgi:2-dehydro-3-deoxyphosphogluconate aldolase/(4S)-4-hydroxy-2-oxoglutarate aldolase
MTERDVLDKLRACRVVPVATLEDPEEAVRVANALVGAGLPCIEVTFRHPAAATALRRAREVDGLLVGAGTVRTPAEARAAAEAGAHFAVAPGTNEDVLAACRELRLPFFPGVATPTEIERAVALGCSAVKVFPAAQCGGVGFLRAVSAVYPDVGFMPTGGISGENLVEYLAVPSVIACGGSWIVKPELVRDGRYDEIARLARDAVEAVEAAR